MALRAGERERRRRRELLGLSRILRVGDVDLIHDGGGQAHVRLRHTQAQAQVTSKPVRV